MLTRLEADGFKNLLDFKVDFGPYTCIAGPNATGKSNIFDAIEFLSLLADHSFMEAATRLRSDTRSATDPKSLFYADGPNELLSMRLAAEMLLPDRVEDDFGRLASPRSTFVRYELELEYEAPESRAHRPYAGRIALKSESLHYIKSGEAKAHLGWPHSKANFRDKVVANSRSGTAYISTTTDENGDGVVNVHQDGGSRGQPRKSPASRAPRTIVSTTTSSDDPTILAARREMQNWRTLSFEPSAMRAPDLATEQDRISTNGAHLPAALFRLASSLGEDIYAQIASETSALTDVRAVHVDFDMQRDLLTLQAKIGDSPMLPARALSDGTLRFLALCVIAADPEYTGVLCMEEPENGIHPGRIEAMVELVRGLAVDPQYAPNLDNPLRQVLVNTHSPFFVQYQNADDLLLAMAVKVDRDGSEATTTRLLPLVGSWRDGHGVQSISREAIMVYLKSAPGGQLTLPILEGDEFDE